MRYCIVKPVKVEDKKTGEVKLVAPDAKDVEVTKLHRSFRAARKYCKTLGKDYRIFRVRNYERDLKIVPILDSDGNPVKKSKGKHKGRKEIKKVLHGKYFNVSLINPPCPL